MRHLARRPPTWRATSIQAILLAMLAGTAAAGTTTIASIEEQAGPATLRLSLVVPDPGSPGADGAAGLRLHAELLPSGGSTISATIAGKLVLHALDGEPVVQDVALTVLTVAPKSDGEARAILAHATGLDPLLIDRVELDLSVASAEVGLGAAPPAASQPLRATLDLPRAEPLTPSLPQRDERRTR